MDSFQLFDSSPSSCTLLREKPLGINYHEPTIKELMAPMAPDRSLLRSGMFSRSIHAVDNRRRHHHHDKSPRRVVSELAAATTTTASSAATPRAKTSPTTTASPHSQQQQSSPKKQDSSPSPPHAQQQQQTTLHASFGEQPTGATSTTPQHTHLVADGADQHQQPSPPAAGAATTTPGAHHRPSATQLLGRGLHRASRSTDDKSPRAGEESSPEARRRAALRQSRPTPTALLPTKGRLPDGAELVLAEVHSFAQKSARSVEQFVAHGREVTERKANVSPVKYFDDFLKKTSPYETDEDGDPTSWRTTTSAKRGGGSGRSKGKRSSSSSQKKQQQQQQEPSSPTTSKRKRRGGRKSRSPVNNNSGNDMKKNDDDADNSSGSDNDQQQQPDDPDLVPGLVQARSQMPPWAQPQEVEVTREALAMASALTRGGKKTNNTAMSPRFARPTEARTKSLSGTAAVKQQQQQHNNNDHPDGDHHSLEARNIQFAVTLRSEDKTEAERRRQALKEQRQRHLDEMILARLSPAEREARLANRAALDPYRKMNDRTLPFPDQAARDRMLHAQMKVPPLVLEGLHQAELISSRWHIQQQQQHGSPTRTPRGGGDADNIALLISSVSGLSTSGTGYSPSPRVGAGGELPAEGTPRQKNPTGPEVAQKMTNALGRFDAQEKQLAGKYANLETKIMAKQVRAANKKFHG